MPPTISGILMMIGAVVWFFAGAAVNLWYPQAAILFLIGLFQFCRGLFTTNESQGNYYPPATPGNYPQAYGQNFNQITPPPGYGQPGTPPQGYPQQGYAPPGQTPPVFGQQNPYQDK